MRFANNWTDLFEMNWTEYAWSATRTVCMVITFVDAYAIMLVCFDCADNGVDWTEQTSLR